MALTITDVASIEHPDLEPYRTLKRPWSIRKKEFCAEGERLSEIILEFAPNSLYLLTPGGLLYTTLLERGVKPSVSILPKRN